MTLAELKLSVRATNCLESENIHTVRDLVHRTEDQLLEVRNFGETTLNEVQRKTRRAGAAAGHAVAAAARRRVTLAIANGPQSYTTISPKTAKYYAMRHRRKGRILGRSPSHQRALLRNLATACS